MKIIENFNGKFGKNVGIMENAYAGKTSYIAVTNSASKTFKSIKGAANFLAKYGYKNS